MLGFYKRFNFKMSLKRRFYEEKNNNAKILAFCGPSGAGKSTLIKILVNKLANIGIYELKYSVSHTTRKPRSGEIEGKDYFFVDDEKFNNMVGAGEFLEYTRNSVSGAQYGTSKAQLNAIICSENIGKLKVVILDLDLDGIRSLPTVIGNFPPKYKGLVNVTCFNTLITTKELKTCVERMLQRSPTPDKVTDEIVQRTVKSGEFFIAPVLPLYDERKRVAEIESLFNLIIKNETCENLPESKTVIKLTRNILRFLHTDHEDVNKMNDICAELYGKIKKLKKNCGANFY